MRAYVESAFMRGMPHCLRPWIRKPEPEKARASVCGGSFPPPHTCAGRIRDGLIIALCYSAVLLLLEVDNER